jgi:putative oxidoreductase
MAEVSALDPVRILRVVCGLWFLPHVIGKLRNVGPASNTFEKAGFRPGRIFVLITAAAEISAATGLAFDIYPKVAALSAVVVLAGASYAVLRINGFNWRWQKQGPEYMVFWIIACALSVIR